MSRSTRFAEERVELPGCSSALAFHLHPFENGPQVGEIGRRAHRPVERSRGGHRRARLAGIGLRRTEPAAHRAGEDAAQRRPPIRALRDTGGAHRVGDAAHRPDHPSLVSGDPLQAGWDRRARPFRERRRRREPGRARAPLVRPLAARAGAVQARPPRAAHDGEGVLAPEARTVGRPRFAGNSFHGTDPTEGVRRSFRGGGAPSSAPPSRHLSRTVSRASRCTTQASGHSRAVPWRIVT